MQVDGPKITLKVRRPAVEEGDKGEIVEIDFPAVPYGRGGLEANEGTGKPFPEVLLVYVRVLEEVNRVMGQFQTTGSNAPGGILGQLVASGQDVAAMIEDLTENVKRVLKVNSLTQGPDGSIMVDLKPGFSRLVESPFGGPSYSVKLRINDTVNLAPDEVLDNGYVLLNRYAVDEDPAK